MSIQAERRLRDLADERGGRPCESEPSRSKTRRQGRGAQTSRGMQTSWPEPSRPPPPRPPINADAQPKTSRNLPRPPPHAQRGSVETCRVRRIRRRQAARSADRGPLDRHIDVDRNGKPGFEPRGSDGRPSVIELVERRENGIGEFGALSSEAGEEDNGFFVGNSGQRFNHAWRRFFDQTAFQEIARLHASHRPQSAGGGGCCLAIEIGKQFDQRRHDIAARADVSASRRAYRRLRMSQKR